MAGEGQGYSCKRHDMMIYIYIYIYVDDNRYIYSPTPVGLSSLAKKWREKVRDIRASGTT